MQTISGGSQPDALRQAKLPALGIDIGGTKIAAAVFDGEKLISEIVRIPTPPADQIIDALHKLILQFQEKYVLVGAGIATAGIVNTKLGEITGSTDNIPGWTGAPVKRTLEAKTLISIHLENDANAAAYGEARANNLSEQVCVVMITLGTGIGGGIIINGGVYRGHGFGAGEVGHMPISMENKRLCSCGHFDCWEAYGAGRGLLATAKEILAGLSADQTPLAKNLDQLTTREVVEACAKGDIIGKRIIDAWHRHIAAGLAIVAQILNPSAFILTGGLSEIVDLTLLQDLVKDRTDPGIGEPLQLYKSQLGENAGIIGAACLVLDAVHELAV